MSSSPEHKGQAEAGAKARSEDRRAQLETFRAAQAAKKAASLGQKAPIPATAPMKSSRARVPGNLVAEQTDPSARSTIKKATSLSPDRKPAKPPPARVKPPVGPARGKPEKIVQEIVPPPAEPEPAKQSLWMEAQQAFGYETPRPDSRRGSQAGEPVALPTAATGSTVEDSGDPNTGIRWQIQMERLRLQQWRIINRRMAAASGAQQKQAENQLELAAEAVVALRGECERMRLEQAKKGNAQHAANALAAQLPRLELYTAMQESHEASMEKVSNAVAVALQQMPLINGATCSGSAEAEDATSLRTALEDVKNALAMLEPRVKPFMGKTANSALEQKGMKENCGSGLCGTAASAAALTKVDSELQAFLKSNADLLLAVEREVVHAESLAAQLALCEEAQST